MKKNHYELISGVCKIWKSKFLKRMRIVALLILISITQTFAVNSYGQSKRLSLDMKNETIINILEKIEDQSEFYFMYDASRINVNQRKTVDCENQLIRNILDQLFENTGITYSINDRQVLLTTIDKSDIEQQKTVSGKVTDFSGSPLPGVTVVVKGTTNGTVTNANGEYSLANVTEDALLQFSFVGMKKQEISVGSQTNINVTMVEDAVGIEEVVAIGYGTLKKDELTSSVSSVKSDDFVKGYVSDAAQLLTGKIAGLNIVKPNANPLSESQISFRGITTLMSGTSPLVIIDGIPGSLSEVAAQDIESIDVLKDGSAAAIYGTRGTNGVILITTKKVRGETPPTIEYQTYFSVQDITKKLDLMNAEEYRQLVQQGKPGAFDNGGDTDWVDEITRNALSHDHNLVFKAGQKNSNYIINLNYKQLEGIIKRTDNNVFTGRIEVNHSMFDGKLRINANILGKQQKYFSGLDDKTYRMALVYNPTSPLKDENGDWYEEPSRNNYQNPMGLLYETEGQYVKTELKTYGFLEYSPINNLSLKMVASHTLTNGINGTATTFNHINNFVSSYNGTARRSSNKGESDLFELTSTYSKDFKNHKFTILGGYSWQKSESEGFNAYNWDFPSDQYLYNNLSAGKALKAGKASMDSYKDESKLVGYFVRGHYNFKNKYLLTASIRHEGSSKFGSGNKWGNFPSISAGWNLKKESFMGKADLISNLKIRIGYGITGTIPSSSYLSLSLLNYGDNILSNGKWIPGLGPTSNPNPYLRWEKKRETNIGFDLGFLEDRISITADIYKRKTTDLLWNYNVPCPPYIYTTIVANAGVMENKGIEVQLSLIPIKKKNFSWISNINFSTNKNTLVALNGDDFIVEGGYFDTGVIGEPIQTTSHRVEEGGRIGNFWGYETVDIDDDGNWIILNQEGNPIPIAEQTPEDKRIIGNGLPKYYTSWNNLIRYGDFDFEINMRGAFKYQILNEARMFFEVPVNLNRGNILSTAYHNRFGKRPLNDLSDYQYVSYYIEDGDYFKIDNVTIGYNLSGFKNTFIKECRVYLSTLNLATFTKYKGIDPEVNVVGLTPGVDSINRYPAAQTYTLGVNIKF